MKKYKAIGKIGEGTFSEVIKMQNLKDGSYYACKQMKQHFESIEQVNNLREIQALRRLNPHPNILTLHEVVFDRKTGSLALICELMDMNIYELIRGRRRPLSEKKITNYMYQLCKSLDHMHRNGIFHRDVKPENILIKQDLLKLGDFGSCRSVYSKQPYTEYISTRWYRAPECLLTDGYYSYKMDMWSAGCVFYEIMRSRAMSFDFPFKNGSGISLTTSTLSPQCLSLIYAMVEYDPDERISAHQALQHSYFREQRISEKQALVARRKVGLTERLGEPESLKNMWQISKEGKKQYLKQVEEHSERQGSTCPVELPKLKVSGVTKLSSYSSPTLRAVLSGSGTSGKVPVLKPLKYIGTNKKTDTQKDIKSNMKQYRLPTIERKSGGY
ncbi:MAPK/MAK/MRK overlapping kinase isoform X3 [Dromiciops gliroides]|uniref:MAPK/MAK/MRK overlapping kinase isoform X3 n=1 Tax=Dromiciops gliroides TaxID=33562 RepID=UPI001CC7176E|nr:MAPK/MAK/MRK overlapping kinase isoform X3 [Dromiciops gliroides]